MNIALLTSAGNSYWNICAWNTGAWGRYNTWGWTYYVCNIGSKQSAIDVVWASLGAED